ncbi:Hypothetical Protein RRSL_04787 [Ralstonia solanacearum UW551]|nr:hypothetical protein CCY86_22805 [Ralstonia solanacearum]EAP74915.1 Hypothetical Protein RRSL_04787 [Ralstonia solanacearum UW551]OPK49397.1 hypothetical protein B5S37_21560 [Ralstonia solanacearum]OPK50532.1 hypothetical protein B5G54_03635 [Ralstonia solanacearum]OPK52490.1 hypothetical protein B5J95_17225 [Ralstonia solanacearum]
MPRAMEWAAMRQERSVDVYPLKQVKAKDVRDYGYEQSIAFGVLFLILGLVMSVAMLAAKHPVAMERAICWAIALLVDWRIWAMLAPGFLLAAIACLLRKSQRQAVVEA